MQRNTYLIVSILAILIGTAANYAMLDGSGSGSRSHSTGGGYGSFGSYSGGHK